MTRIHRYSFPRALPGLVLAGVLALLPAQPASAEDDDGIRQTVARVSYLSGSVAFSRGDDPDHWQDATINVPLTLGDRLWTEPGARAELQTDGGRIFIGAGTQLSILDLRDDVTQLSLSVGMAAFRIRQLAEGEAFEIDTPNAAVTLRTEGRYRVFVDEDGNTRVDVSHGSAVAAVGPDLAELRGGEALSVRGLEAPVYELDAPGAPDSFDRWADERDVRERNAVSARYVGGGIAGLEDLDVNGRWERIPEYGWAWSPRLVGSLWAPYRDGRWVWQDPWGWTWVSGEPWGWAPYHYGSWVFFSGRWCWVPDGPQVRVVRYAPARVVFVGAGPGGAAVRTGPASYIGWFPVHPRDRFVPWWGRTARVSAATVAYVNRSRVTVVPRETFVGGGSVRELRLRDARLVREVSSAPVHLGPLPFVPTISSLRFAAPGLHHDVARPPERYLDRHVTTHLPPPPHPPAFDAKLGFIRENRGRPYTHVETERVVPTRPPDRHTTSSPGPERRDMRPARPEPKPPEKPAWQRDTTRSGPKPEPARPYRPDETTVPTRRVERTPMRPPDPAVKVPTRTPAPAVKAPTPAPKPHVVPDSQEKIHRALRETPVVSKAPPEKKPPPEKKDDRKDHSPQPN